MRPRTWHLHLQIFLDTIEIAIEVIGISTELKRISENKMSTSTQTYAAMLTVQADMAFPYERTFFENEDWISAKNILDFGAGNCAYAALLSGSYPEKSFTCVEHDPAMRELIGRQIVGRPIVVNSDLTKLKKASQDFAIMRLVLLHIADRAVVYKQIVDLLRPKSSLLVLDADDEYFFISPPPTRFLESLAAIKGRSKDRELRGKVSKEISPFGFTEKLHHRILINSGTSIAKLQMYVYMKLTAEAALDGVRDGFIEDELIDWYLNPSSYAQYGIFGTLFQRNMKIL